MNIVIQQLTKVYPGNVPALDNLSLTIPSGMFGLLGPNGAGKTTLLRIIAGLLRPTAGKVVVGAHDISTKKGSQEIKKLIGYLPQELGIYPDLSAYEFLDYVGTLKGLYDRKQRQQRVEEVLELVALHQAARRSLKTYSGGMKRRVGIAQALLNDPKVLIVDEPTVGLDPEERIRFRNLLSHLGTTHTVLLSTHIVEDIALACRYIVVMKQGHILFQGTVADLVKEIQNKVWLISTSERILPPGDFTIVRMLNLGDTIQYRVVGDPPTTFSPTLTSPNLEDAYMWLLHASKKNDRSPITLAQ
jgi:ABC-type multidrug transport system ATPase subunit